MTHPQKFVDEARELIREYCDGTFMQDERKWEIVGCPKAIIDEIALALQKAEARGRLFNVGLEQENRIHDLELKLAGLYGYADIQGMEFVKHIKAHLKDGQEVICKICGKTVEQIALEAVE